MPDIDFAGIARAMRDIRGEPNRADIERELQARFSRRVATGFGF